MTLPGLAAVILLLTMAIWGYQKGLVKEIVSLLFVFAVFAIVSWINPRIDGALLAYEPLQKTIQESLISLGDSKNQLQELLKEKAAVALSDHIINGISFLLSYLLANIIVRSIVFLLDIMTKLPVIGGINRLAGGAIGLLEGVIILWVAFLAFTVLCGTGTGRLALHYIQVDPFLKYLYQNDILIEIFF